MGAVLASSILLTGIGDAQADPPPPPVDHYHLDVALDPAARTVTGRFEIRWTNRARVPLSTLYVHLYLNAFEGPGTVFMRESGGRLRGVPAEGTGSIALRSLRLEEGDLDLLATADTTVIEGDRTQLRLTLPTPLTPGATVVLRGEMLATLPPIFARTGHAGGFFAIAQWFPKIARVEADGRWASFPYHGMGEFYADFADWEVRFAAPSEYEIVATGREQPAHTSGSITTHHFRASRVHDFALFAARDAEIREQAGSPRIRALIPRGYGWIAPRYIEVTRAALDYYRARYGPYPYDTLSLVLPTRGARGAAGMEYPTLVVAGGPWFPIPGMRSPFPDDITAHEIAHQWFYGLVASNEVESPALDEGLTQWATNDFLRALHPPHEAAANLAGLEFDPFELLRAYAIRGGPSRPPASPAYVFSANEYGRAVYGRSAAILETVRRAYGDARFRRALADYTTRQRFAHPTFTDLFASFDRIYGPGFSSLFLEPAFRGGLRGSLRLDRFDVRREGRGYVAEVRATRRGFEGLPTWIALTTASGRVHRFPFPAGSASLALTHHDSEPILTAELDPDRAVVVDDSLFDNTRRAPTHRAPTTALFSRALFAAQILLRGLAL